MTASERNVALLATGVAGFAVLLAIHIGTKQKSQHSGFRFTIVSMLVVTGMIASFFAGRQSNARNVQKAIAERDQALRAREMALQSDLAVKNAVLAFEGALKSSGQDREKAGEMLEFILGKILENEKTPHDPLLSDL